MLNKVTLIGRLGADPEVRYQSSGSPVVNVNMATTRRWKDKQSGERKEQTEWHRIVFFNRLADIAKDFLSKGGLIYLEGHIRTKKWQDQAGQDRYTTQIIAEQMQMLGAKQSNDASSSPQPISTDNDEFDDDVPF